MAMGVVLPSLIGLGVWRELQHRLKIEMGGKFVPAVLLPSFEIRDAHFEWDDKVKLISGHLKVEYHPMAYLLSRGPWIPARTPAALRITLSGNQLVAELLGSWAERQGLRSLPIDRFHADLALGPRGLDEIFSLEVDSPVFQFHVQKSETLERKDRSPQEKTA